MLYYHVACCYKMRVQARMQAGKKGQRASRQVHTCCLARQLLQLLAAHMAACVCMDAHN